MQMGDIEGTVPGGLLAHLLRYGVITQGEVAVTRSIVYCLSLPGGSHALDGLIAATGVVPGDKISWRAEAIATTGVRPDIEGWWGDPPVPRVVIEAKLGHDLTGQQIADYVANLSEDEALVVVLVPEYRRREAEAILRAVTESQDWPGPQTQGTVWSYYDVMQALVAAVDHRDVQQLGGLVEACEAMDIKPLEPKDLLNSENRRVADIQAVLDQATSTFFEGRRTYPGDSDRHFAWRRYVEVLPEWTHIAVGIRLANAPAARLWAWVRVHASTPGATAAGEVLRRMWPETTARDREGNCWLSLSLPVGVSGATMVREVTTQIDAVLSALRAEVGRS
jgi:hypothetical protein